MTPPTLRPLGFGEILDRAFTLYRRNFLLFAGTSLLTMFGVFVAFVVLALVSGIVVGAVPGLALPVLLLLSLGVAAVATIPWGVLARQASQAYSGRPASLGDGLSAGFRAAVALVGAGILAAVSIAVLMLLVLLAAYCLNLLAGGMGIPSVTAVMGILTTVGTVTAFFLVAALYFGLVPAVVVEEKGPVEAVSRSVELAQGALPRIAGAMVVSLIITYLPILALVAVTGGFAAMADPAAGGDMAALVLAMAVQQLLTLLITVLTTPFLVSVIVVLYYDRRVRTEALDVQIVTEQLGLAGA